MKKSNGVLATSIVIAIWSMIGVEASPCATDLDCSLNGLCQSKQCVCDKPWGGPACGVLQYKVTPAVAKSLFPVNDTRNTWNGPIAVGPNGTYHIFDPIYPEENLGRSTSILHGIASRIEGPWTWDARPAVRGVAGNNPAPVVILQRTFLD